MAHFRYGRIDFARGCISTQNLLRVLMAGLLLVLLVGSACRKSQVVSEVPAPTPLATPTDEEPDLKLASEIELRRIHSGCEGCDDHSLILRRDANNIFADAFVIRTDLNTKKQRTGTLYAYYYNHLIQLIKSESVLELDDEYAMNWVDSLIVTLKISIGDRHKMIRTTSEGDVPLKLWGFFMAVDGAAAHIKWNDAPTNSR